MENESPGRKAGNKTWFLGVLLILGLAWTFRSATMVTLPIAAAILLALAVAPVSAWAQQRLPDRLNWLGNVLALLVLIAFLAIFVAGLTLAGQQIVSGAERYLPQLQQQYQQSALAGMLGGGKGISRALQNIASYATTALNSIWQTIAGIILILFLVLLMLIEAPAWKAKLATIDRQNGKWEKSAAVIGQQFRSYFLTRLMLGAITAALYVGWLALFGVDFLIVWGLLAFLLNFVPTVGSLIAGIFPVLFAFAQKDPGTALLIAGGLLVIEQVMGNFVDPRLLGHRLSVSPLVILVSLLVWSWIWGVAGALVAVPMTVLLTVCFARVPTLRPLALLLSNARSMDELDEKTSLS